MRLWNGASGHGVNPTRSSLRNTIPPTGGFFVVTWAMSLCPGLLVRTVLDQGCTALVLLL